MADDPVISFDDAVLEAKEKEYAKSDKRKAELLEKVTDGTFGRHEAHALGLVSDTGSSVRRSYVCKTLGCQVILSLKTAPPGGCGCAGLHVYVDDTGTKTLTKYTGTTDAKKTSRNAALDEFFSEPFRFHNHDPEIVPPKPFASFDAVVTNRRHLRTQLEAVAVVDKPIELTELLSTDGMKAKCEEVENKIVGVLKDVGKLHHFYVGVTTARLDNLRAPDESDLTEHPYTWHSSSAGPHPMTRWEQTHKHAARHGLAVVAFSLLQKDPDCGGGILTSLLETMIHRRFNGSRGELYKYADAQGKLRSQVATGNDAGDGEISFLYVTWRKKLPKLLDPTNARIDKFMANQQARLDSLRQDWLEADKADKERAKRAHKKADKESKKALIEEMERAEKALIEEMERAEKPPAKSGESGSGGGAGAPASS